jgi:acyl-CoA synthetase (AMP-forming)/AMP-acid ligase II
MRIADYLESTASRTPGKEALVFGGERITYEQANKTVDAIANALRRTAGLVNGSHVALFTPNDIRVSLLQLGINRADMAWAALHDKNPVETNAQLAAYLDSSLVFFHSAYESSLAALKAAMPAVKHWVCIDAESAHGLSLEQWLEGAWKPFAYSAPDLDLLAAIYPTGGTTGPSKGACHTHRGLAFMLHGLVSSWDFDHSARMLTVAPLSHAAGLFALALIPNGATNVILSGFNAELVLATIAAEKITHVFLPPTALYALMVHPGVASADISSLRCMVIGAAPVAPEKFRQAVELFGPILHEGYAQSETGMPVLNKYPADYMLPDGTIDEAVLRSAGRATTFVRVEIVDEEGNVLPHGQRGEIAVRAAQLMKGYYKRPKETEEVRRNGFHLTGDVGIMDARGYVTIVDRKKDMIVTGGFNVFPAEVESVINGHEDVLDCIVIGVPDEKWGEAIRALVQLKPGRSLQPEAVIAFCKERLGGVKTPKAVELVTDLPRSAVGKLLRREARAKYWEGHWRSV